MSHEHLRLRELLRKAPVDPEESLKRIASLSITREQWRARDLKEVRETYDACLFAYGLGKLFNREVSVIPGEVEDYDCALRTTGDGELLVAGVQLKELPPAELNSALTLSDLIERVAASQPTDAWLLIRLNRHGYIPDETLNVPMLPYAEVWFLWANSPDGLHWCIYGDAKRRDAHRFEFSYPQ